MRTLTFGYSPCPNDTFAFHALAHGLVDAPFRVEPVLLDIDLDCFTSLSDADPQAILPWTEGLVRDYLLPEGSEEFWEELLPRVVAMTLAREPYHCGGLLAQGRLLELVAPVLFGTVLGARLS